MEHTMQIAVFGGGCFWCTEAIFDELRGVVSVMPGYAGGNTEDPTYHKVSSGNTGHAEVVRIEYDSEKISYTDLLSVFFATHDPTTKNRQGADIGTEYRSLILYVNENQKKEAETFVAKLNQTGTAVVTGIEPLGTFYTAEEYHKKYYQNNATAPYCQIVISPKLEKLREKFSALLKKPEEK